MSSKDKKVQAAALRHFLVETPDALDRATASLGWLVMLAAVALGALLLHLAFARPAHHQMAVPGGQDDNPTSALYVRDLGRLSDGRHTFDLIYRLVLRNATDRPFSLVFSRERLAITDPATSGDVVALVRAPDAFTQPPPTGNWHVLLTRMHDDHNGWQPETYPPGRWRVLWAHYRINARPEQVAAVAIGYGLHRPRGWFDHPGETEDDSHDEEVQLGAVLRAHCALGVKIQNGEMRSLCGS